MQLRIITMDNCIICKEPLGSEKSIIHNVDEVESKMLASQAYKFGDSTLKKKFYCKNLRLHKTCFVDYLNKTPTKAKTHSENKYLRSSGLF